MSKIDEIKHRVEQFKHNWEISRGCCDVEDFSEEVLLLIEENNRIREECYLSHLERLSQIGDLLTTIIHQNGGEIKITQNSMITTPRFKDVILIRTEDYKDNSITIKLGNK